MIGIDFSPLENCVWNSLAGSHSHLGIRNAGATRYIREISPFAALQENTVANLKDLADIVSVGESILIRGDIPDLGTEWVLERHTLSLQFLLPAKVRADFSEDLVALSEEHIPAMLELTQLVLPGYFQKRSIAMGSFYGIFDEKKLVAMTGERIFPKPFKEITAVCTHPDYQRRGYAARLVTSVAAQMRREGNIPFLHTGTKNARARALYLRLGFQERAETSIVGLRRV